ncbi:uncharacterized protein LOC131671655 [Phymastichus coffea]|uniref:uncharacterized protein LOC131671655 n=1 Tax=Phymastichus coffea TaxID=108790 RepID=UPI00273AA28B|nr:uncharacterized protein LOC131671655 [Phymastichus coffea]
MATYTSKLKILFWNALSINQRKGDTPTLLNNVDIFICVESWLQGNNSFNISGFKSYKKSRQHSRGGGILYLVRNNIQCEVIEDVNTNIENLEILAIKVKCTSPHLNIVTCYRVPKPGHSNTQSEWNEIVNFTDLNPNTLLFGNFNAHNVRWNCEKTDSNGERFEQAIDSKNLFLHNSDSKTHLEKRSGKLSNLDLALSTMCIADNIEVKVFDETLGSDHFPILLCIDVNKVTYEKKTFKLCSKKTDWSVFERHINGRYHAFLTIDYENKTPSQKYDFFIQVVSETVESATPRKKCFRKYKKSNPVPWWDQECDRIKRLRRVAFKKWRFTNLQSDLIIYEKCCAIAKRTFAKKKEKVLENSRNKSTSV